MKIIETKKFFKTLPVQQMSEFVTEIQHQMIYDVIPSLEATDTIVEYRHFMTLEQPDGSKKYISATTEYTDLNGNMKRDIQSIRVYTDEVEWDFYMMLFEYENQMDPNPILFN